MVKHKVKMAVLNIMYVNRRFKCGKSDFEKSYYQITFVRCANSNLQIKNKTEIIK